MVFKIKLNDGAPSGFDFKVKVPESQTLSFKRDKITVPVLPPVPDAIVRVGEVEEFLADIPILDELPVAPAEGQLIIYTGDEEI